MRAGISPFSLTQSTLYESDSAPYLPLSIPTLPLPHSLRTGRAGQGSGSIIVYGDFFLLLKFSEAKATYLAFKNQPNLKQIEAKKNELTYEGVDFLGAPNLVTLDLSYNKNYAF